MISSSLSTWLLRSKIIFCIKVLAHKIWFTGGTRGAATHEEILKDTDVSSSYNHMTLNQIMTPHQQQFCAPDFAYRRSLVTLRPQRTAPFRKQCNFMLPNTKFPKFGLWARLEELSYLRLLSQTQRVHHLKVTWLWKNGVTSIKQGLWH